MNGFTKLAFYEIDTDSISSLPTYKSTAIKLYSGDKTNNISIEITSKESTRTRKADNIVEEEIAETGYDAVVTVYGVDKSAQSQLLGSEVDGNGNLIMTVNGTKKKYGAFYEAMDMDGTQVQVYLSKVTIGTIVPSTKTDEHGDPESITLNLKGSFVKYKGKDTRGFLVYAGQEGFVESGFPTGFYTPAEVVETQTSNAGDSAN